MGSEDVGACLANFREIYSTRGGETMFQGRHTLPCGKGFCIKPEYHQLKESDIERVVVDDEHPK